MKRPTFDSVLSARLSRRTVVAGAAATVGLAACAQIPTKRDPATRSSSFNSMAPQKLDVFAVADGYRYNIIARWGDSLVTGTADFDTRRFTDTGRLNADAVAKQGSGPKP